MAADKRLTFRFNPIDPDELLQRSFLLASEAADKEDVGRLKPVMKARIKEKVRLRAAAKHISGSLSRLERSIPRTSQLNPFYRELLDILGGSELEDTRLRIGRAARNVGALSAGALRRLNRSGNPTAMHEIRKGAYGRISSVARALGPEMKYLAELNHRLREMPVIDFDLPTVVIAGCPNVGKTTLLKCLTGSSPEIRPFPFTTKSLQLGYYQAGWTRIQVIDTPGLLDRPLERRSPTELKAVGALGHLADAIVFIIDPTTSSGFELHDQISLARQIVQTFPKPMLIAVNKVDIASRDQIDAAKSSFPGDLRVFEVCGTDHRGVEDLRSAISSYLIEHRGHSQG